MGNFLFLERISMNISVIGAGYVGLVTGTCLADAGNNILRLDLDKEKISSLKNGKILDVGCGIGIVAINIAKKLSKSSIVGIDINKKNIEKANELLAQNNISNVSFVNGDINDQEDIKSDYVILSNILEHIEKRTRFLKNIQKITNAKTFLIRVPNFERDWQIAMRKKLGIYYFSDKDHKIEHTLEEFKEEIQSSNLKIIEIFTIWGEIWANCINE